MAGEVNNGFRFTPGGETATAYAALGDLLVDGSAFLGFSGNPDLPKAYLTYHYFDAKHHYLISGFVQVSEGANGNFEELALTFTADQQGYVYLYVANETMADFNVFFDDVEVQHSYGPVIEASNYYPFGMEYSHYERTFSKPNYFLYNGKELQKETQWYDYGARMYMPDLGRWMSPDPLAHEYFNVSPYTYVLNNPINAIDPDGKRVFFVAGAGNDQIGWDYVNRWGKAFERSGISGFTRLNVSHDDPISVRNGGKPFGDMIFSSSFRSSRYDRFLSSTSGMVQTVRKQDKMIDKAISDIQSNLVDNPLAEGEQLNLAGYSYGSVLQAHAALGLADKDQKIDNLILIGSPISSDSELYESLTNHENIGNVIRVDIEGDLFSDPEGIDFVRGILQNLGIDGAHFDLARPGAEADKRIQETTDDLKKQGVN